MDGGSGLNIMYAKTLDKMGVDRTRLRPTRVPFHGIVPRKQVMPLGQIDLLEWHGLLPGYDAVERHSGWAEARTVDAHHVEHLGIHDVEAAASVH